MAFGSYSGAVTTTSTSALETKAAMEVSGTRYPDLWFVNLLGGASTASKVRVNAETAVRCPPVKRAVDLISSTIATLPVRLLKTVPSGQVPATDHPASRIVSRRANPWTFAGPFRGLLARDALLHGDGFALVVRNGAGQPRELHHLPPGTVSVELDEITREPIYSVTMNGDVVLVSWRDVLHVMAPSLDGITGASPVHLGREAIGLALTLERHAARLFGNGARPGLALTFPGKLGKETAERMKLGWDYAFNGERSGGTAVLEEGADVKQLTLTSVDSQFLQLRQHQVRELANVFGLPSTMLNDMENVTLGNAEALGQAFRDETILPWVIAFEAAYERALLTEEEADTHAIAFDTDALDRADMAAKADAMSKRRASGVVTANEERKHLNLPAMTGGDELGSPFTTANTAKPEAPANV